MGHHIDAEGRFQSDKHPELPPDRIRLNLANPKSERALRALAADYRETDSELADDLVARLDVLHGAEEGPPRPRGGSDLASVLRGMVTHVPWAEFSRGGQDRADVLALANWLEQG